jgi:hypothetical protein
MGCQHPSAWPLPKAGVEGQQWQMPPDCEFQINCVIDGQPINGRLNLTRLSRIDPPFSEQDYAQSNHAKPHIEGGEFAQKGLEARLT